MLYSQNNVKSHPTALPYTYSMPATVKSHFLIRSQSVVSVYDLLTVMKLTEYDSVFLNLEL
jgi:hypothetical protein